MTLAKFLDECYMFCGLCILMHVKTCLCMFEHAQAISLLLVLKHDFAC